MELRNYSPEMLKILLDSVKLRLSKMLINDFDKNGFKALMKWQVDIELALNDAMFEKRQLPDERFEPKNWHLNSKG